MSTTELEKPKAQAGWPDFPPGIPVMTPELLQQAIEEADRDIEAGLGIPHETVMAEAQKWLDENP